MSMLVRQKLLPRQRGFPTECWFCPRCSPGRACITPIWGLGRVLASRGLGRVLASGAHGLCLQKLAFSWGASSHSSHPSPTTPPGHGPEAVTVSAKSSSLPSSHMACVPGAHTGGAPVRFLLMMEEEFSEKFPPSKNSKIHRTNHLHLKTQWRKAQESTGEGEMGTNEIGPHEIANSQPFWT